MLIFAFCTCLLIYHVNDTSSCHLITNRSNAQRYKSQFSGYICCALPGSRLDELEIPMMVPENQERHRTAYTVTVDYKHGMSSSHSNSPHNFTSEDFVRVLNQPKTRLTPISISLGHPFIRLFCLSIYFQTRQLASPLTTAL